MTTAPAPKVKVLIADDDEHTRDGTRRWLEREKAIEIVGFAGNGQEAIERVRELQPHVVVMDINMPVMDGIEATRRLREEAPHVSVIIVSVQCDDIYLKEALRAGAVDFLCFPITPEDLMQAILRPASGSPAKDSFSRE